MMGDFIVLTLVAIMIISILYYLFKDKNKGISAACKGCAMPRSIKHLDKMPMWVNEYKGTKHE
jgi:hypothetical protein